MRVRVRRRDRLAGVGSLVDRSLTDAEVLDSEMFRSQNTNRRGCLDPPARPERRFLEAVLSGQPLQLLGESSRSSG